MHDRLNQSKFLFQSDFPYQVFVLRSQLLSDDLAISTLIRASAVLRRVFSVCLDNLSQIFKLLLVCRRDEVLSELLPKSEQHTGAESRMVSHL